MITKIENPHGADYLLKCEKCGRMFWARDKDLREMGFERINNKIQAKYYDIYCPFCHEYNIVRVRKKGKAKGEEKP